MTKQFDTKDGKERIVIDYDPSDPDYEFADISRYEKPLFAKRFKCVESVAIPRELVESVCKALKGAS